MNLGQFHHLIWVVFVAYTINIVSIDDVCRVRGFGVVTCGKGGLLIGVDGEGALLCLLLLLLLCLLCLGVLGEFERYSLCHFAHLLMPIIHTP